MIFDELRALIGSPPAGYEMLEYVIAAVLLVFLLQSCVSFVSALLNWVGGKR